MTSHEWERIHELEGELELALKERDSARKWAKAWKALAKELRADEIHTFEDYSGGGRNRVVFSYAVKTLAYLREKLNKNGIQF